MALVDVFLVWWLKWGRYPWSRLRRAFFERRHLKLPLPSASSVEEIASLLSQVTWTMDGPFHLYDSISFPETVWAKKRDDCDGFAVLAAALLKGWDPSTEPSLVTVMLRPARNSHTVCVFKEGDSFRFFDNSRLEDGVYQTYVEIVTKVKERGRRLICWDVVAHETLQTVEFHRAKG